MNEVEALRLDPELAKKLEEIAWAFSAAGRPTSVTCLANFIQPSAAYIEQLAKEIKLPKQSLLQRIKWWLLDVLDVLREFWRRNRHTYRLL